MQPLEQVERLVKRVVGCRQPVAAVLAVFGRANRVGVDRVVAQRAGQIGFRERQYAVAFGRGDVDLLDADVGFDALSVLIASSDSTFSSLAALMRFCVPWMLVWTASNGLYSLISTCFSAAA